jgi:thymidylate synthase
MDRLVRAATLAEAWEASLRLLTSEGSASSLNRYESRGDPCVELEDVLFDVSHPSREPQVSALYPRDLLPLVDAFTSLLVDRDRGQRSNINGRLYRWRTRGGIELDQVSEIAELLRRNPESRFSVAGFWDPEIDLPSDKPVGSLLAYPRVRAGALNMTVVQRTLDAMTGATQLLVGFSRFQSVLAQLIGARIGALRVLALSYHLLEIDLPRVRMMLHRSAASK